MRYAQIRSMDISNGEGIGVALFVQGCHFHCKNCFNSETWDFNGGKPFTKKEYKKIIELIGNNHISRFSILGGEPLEEQNLQALYGLLNKIRELYPYKKIWLYTGHNFDTIFDSNNNTPSNMMRRKIILLSDFVVDGPFIDELKDRKLEFRGSSNQRIINIKEMNLT